MKNKRTKGGGRGERGGNAGNDMEKSSFTEDDDIDVGSPEEAHQLTHPDDVIRIKMEDRSADSPDNIAAVSHQDAGRILPSELTSRLAGNTSPELGRIPPPAAAMYTSEMFNRLAYPFQSKLFNSCMANVKSNY